MPTIKQRHVQKAKKKYICDGCGFAIFAGDSYVYLYGMAHYGEKPYSLHICSTCEDERVKYHEDIGAVK